MSGFKINVFSGEMPRANPLTLPPTVAEFALDVRLDNGSLRPWRERLPVHTAPTPVLGFIRVGCCWLTDDGCAEFSLLWPSCEFVMRTGVQPYPEIATFTEACAGQWCRLGVPCPSVAPGASPVSPPNLDPTLRSLETRAYRYSWVNKYGREGGGSPPSAPYQTNDGTTSIVQLPPCPDASYCIERINIYRLATPLEAGGEKSNPQNTEYYFVDSVPCGTTVYTDTKTLFQLGGEQGELSIFTREESIPPPDDLTGVVCLENGMLAGFSPSLQMVVLSEAFAPHSWPLKFYKKLWDKPIALAAVASTLYVGTTGTPYTIDGRNDPQGDGLTTVFRHREPLPCISKASMVAASGGAYYASDDGLVAIAGQNSRVVSESLFSKQDWQKLRPNKMKGALLDGFYFGITDVAGIRLKTNEAEHIDDAKASLTRLSDRPDVMWRSPEGFLYMAQGNVISQWDGAATLRTYTWRNVRQHMPRSTSLNAAGASMGIPGNVTVDHISEKGTFTRNVWQTMDYRLPVWFSVREMQFEFRGTGEIKQAEVGTSVKEQVRVAA